VQFRAALADVRSVAVKLEPEVLNLRVAKGFEDASIELVTGSVRRAATVSLDK
jgi:hypothetical protein